MASEYVAEFVNHSLVTEGDADIGHVCARHVVSHYTLFFVVRSQPVYLHLKRPAFIHDAFTIINDLWCRLTDYVIFRCCKSCLPMIRNRSEGRCFGPVRTYRCCSASILERRYCILPSVVPKQVEDLARISPQLSTYRLYRIAVIHCDNLPW